MPKWLLPEHERIRGIIPGLIFLAGFIATTAALAWMSYTPSRMEPDRLFHFSLLRESLAQNVWVLRKWAQYPLLGWSEYFSDKEFLFHFLLQLPYRIAGERGALLACMGFSALLIWLPFLFFRSHRFFAMAVSLAMLPLHHYFLFRFSLLRPHTLAVLLYVAMVLLFLHGRFRLAALAAFLYTLAYHAFYLVILLAAGALVCGEISARFHPQEKSWRIPALWLLLATAAGLLVNPYFPSNIVHAFQHLALGLRIEQLQEALHLSFGGELIPRKPSDFLQAWPVVTALMLLSFYLVARFRRDRGALLLAGLSAFFLLGGLKSPRTLEFGGPVWALLFIVAFRDFQWRRKTALLAVIVGSQAVQLYPTVKRDLAGTFTDVPDPALISRLFEPVQGKKLRVFHDNWAMGPYITYAVPEAEAIDLLDPSYLLLMNPKLAALRGVLNEGQLSEPERAIREGFGADLALVEPTPLRAQLLRNKRAKPITATADGRWMLLDLK